MKNKLYIGDKVSESSPSAPSTHPLRAWLNRWLLRHGWGRISRDLAEAKRDLKMIGDAYMTEAMRALYEVLDDAEGQLADERPSV